MNVNNMMQDVIDGKAGVHCETEDEIEAIVDWLETNTKLQSDFRITRVANYRGDWILYKNVYVRNNCIHGNAFLFQMGKPIRQRYEAADILGAPVQEVFVEDLL